MAKKNCGQEWPHNYLLQQFSAMRWLAKQGLSPEEIRVARWGMVDEGKRTITVQASLFHICYNSETRTMIKKITNREPIQISLKGSGHEDFFIKSRIHCAWMFTAHVPKTWRKQGSEEALFPLSIVEKCCRNIPPLNNSSVLTKIDEFGNIGISKLNITKMKTEEPIEEAEVIS